MPTVNIKENIEILKKAQDLDRDIYKAQEQRKEFPILRDRLKQELELEKNHLKNLEGELKKAQLRQKDKEGELGQKETQVKKLEGQLAMVKTNKEYSTMQQEIASLKADNSLIEEEIIKLIDQVEAAEEEVKKEKERLKQVEKNSQEKEAEIGQKEKVITDSFEGLKKKRDEIITQVAPEVKSLYDAIVQKKQGLALVKVNGEICGACQLQLRAQLMNEIRMAESIVVCENCNRILYFED